MIVDGQQRLTTLTLLLTFLRHRLADPEDKEEVALLIRSRIGGVRSFNIHVEERTECMEALFTRDMPLESHSSESLANISARYGDIRELFPEDILKDSLLPFVDWLIDNVHMIEITAYTEADAYTIFETMNDRGLSLTPAEMLKGYLLKEIDYPEDRDRANDRWRELVHRLVELGKGEAADAIKSWLRSQYAKTIRERKRNATPGDFDLIEPSFIDGSVVTHGRLVFVKVRTLLESSTEISASIASGTIVYAKPVKC